MKLRTARFKTFLTAMFAALMSFMIVGCKSVPTIGQLETASYMIGTTTGVICNMTKINDKDRQVVIDIIGEVSHCTPVQGETLAMAWTKIANEHVAKLVEAGKVTAEEGTIILNVFSSVADAGEYIVEVKWPKVLEYTDLTAAATRGFCNGFLTTFKPADTTSLTMNVVDCEAYMYLLTKKTK